MENGKVVLDDGDVRRALVRIAHEIVERSVGEDLAIVGIHRRGASLAGRLHGLVCDLLVHEATFAHDEVDRAVATLHSTARQAAQVAADAEVRLLALTHLSSRYSGGEIRDEAREVFADTEVPRDFDTIEVPLPERGEPALVRWDGAAQARRGSSPAALEPSS